MKTTSGSNIIRVKNHNRQAILLKLLDAPLSRVELAKQLSISSMTVTNLVNELLEDGLIMQVDEKRNGQRSVGRPRQTLCLNGDALFVVGVHIGIGYLRIGLVNLIGELITVRHATFDIEAKETAVFHKIQAEINALEQDHPTHADKIIGIGVGSPGLVDSEQGVCVMATSLNWQNAELASQLEQLTGHPVVVENNVRAMALGEAYFGDNRTADSLAFIYGRNGIGAGFVMHRELFRGVRAGAGEIGHTIIMPTGGDLCRCGQTGCLETLVTQPVIERQLQTRNTQHTLPDLDTTLSDIERFEQILQYGRSGQPLVQEVLGESGRFLAIALINLVNTLNPERIILGGIYWQGADIFLPQLRQQVQQRAFATLGNHVTIEPASDGLDAGVIGAATVALVRLFFQQNEEVKKDRV